MLWTLIWSLTKLIHEPWVIDRPSPVLFTDPVLNLH